MSINNRCQPQQLSGKEPDATLEGDVRSAAAMNRAVILNAYLPFFSCRMSSIQIVRSLLARTNAAPTKATDHTAAILMLTTHNERERSNY